MGLNDGFMTVTAYARSKLFRPFFFALSGLLVLLLSSCEKDDPPSGGGGWTEKLAVRAELEEGPLLLVLEAASGWYLNTAYPGTEISLPAEGEEADLRLGRGELRFEGGPGEGKAEEAVFELPGRLAGSGTIRGSYRAVVCNEDACSPPFRGEIAVGVPPQ
ncbi:MAG: hypothetical protein ACOCVR_01705 [Myxococcota bacterium]